MKAAAEAVCFTVVLLGPIAGDYNVLELWFRFYGQLNDFLPAAYRRGRFRHVIQTPASVKDVIEALVCPIPKSTSSSSTASRGISPVDCRTGIGFPSIRRFDRSTWQACAEIGR